MGFTSAGSAQGRSTEEQLPQRNQFSTCYLSETVISMSGIYTEVYVPVCTREAVWPIWAASTLRATGILPVWDPAGQGTSLGHGSLHIYGFTFTISFTITYRSGRRAPTLEGGGPSCPFVSSCGDAARERDRFNQSSRDRLRVTHGIRNTWGVIPHSMQPVQVLTY